MSTITAGSLGAWGKATVGSFMSEDDDDRKPRRKRPKPKARRLRTGHARSQGLQ